MKPRQLETRTTQDILNGIVCGEWREPVEHVRSLPVDSKAQLAAKKALPYVIWAGEFKPRRADGLIRNSGQVGVDLDDLTPAQAKGAMHAAMDDKYCLAAFRSVRLGVRLLFRIPPVTAEVHSKIFVQVAKHVRDVYGLRPDMTGRDVCRLSFVSWDKGLWICPEAAILPITLPGPAVRKELAVRSAPVRQTAARVTKPEPSAKHDAGVMWLGAECVPWSRKSDGQTYRTHKSLLKLATRLALGVAHKKWPDLTEKQLLDAAFAGWSGKVAQSRKQLRGDLSEYRKELGVAYSGVAHTKWFKGAAEKWTRWIARPAYPAEGTPREPVPRGFTEAIQQVQRYVSRDSSRFVLACVHLHPKYAEACDNMQAMRCKVQTGLKGSVLVPGASQSIKTPYASTPLDTKRTHRHALGPASRRTHGAIATTSSWAMNCEYEIKTVCCLLPGEHQQAGPARPWNGGSKRCRAEVSEHRNE